MTVDDQGKLIRWEVANDSFTKLGKIHKSFESSKFKVTALAFLSENGLLWSASKRRIYLTNVDQEKNERQINLVTSMQ